MQTNALSALGRMSFGTHMLCYPGLAAVLYFGPYGYYKKSQKESE